MTASASAQQVTASPPVEPRIASIDWPRVAGDGGQARRLPVNLRHGVSRVDTGHRHTAGIIFPDAA